MFNVEKMSLCYLSFNLPQCTRPVLLKEVNEDPELRRFLERNWLDHDKVCGWKGLRS